MWGSPNRPLPAEEHPAYREREVEAVCFTPDRSVHNPEFTDPRDTREMIIVHNQALPVGRSYTVGPRKFTIVRQTDKEEFLARCPQVPRLLGIDRYSSTSPLQLTKR